MTYVLPQSLYDLLARVTEPWIRSWFANDQNRTHMVKWSTSPTQRLFQDKARGLWFIIYPTEYCSRLAMYCVDVPNRWMAIFIDF